MYHESFLNNGKRIEMQNPKNRGPSASWYFYIMLLRFNPPSKKKKNKIKTSKNTSLLKTRKMSK